MEMKYYGIAEDPDSLSDVEWAFRYAILEDIRGREKQQTEEIGQLNF